MRSRVDPGARACLLTRTTSGENTPDLTEEQGEMVRLRAAEEHGSGVGHLRSRLQSSDRTDSLDEARVGGRSGDSGGLGLSAWDSWAAFSPRPRLTSSETSGGLRLREKPPCLPTAVSIAAGPKTKWRAVWPA